MSDAPPGLNTFDHLIVLMLENRSFDNLLGYFYEHDRPARFIGRGEPEFRGVAGRDDLANSDGKTPPTRIPVGKAPFETPLDMCHPCPDPGQEYQPHATRPCNASSAVTPGTCWRSSSRTTPTLKGSLPVDMASLVPVTTMSSRWSGSAWSRKSWRWGPAVSWISRNTWRYPMDRTVSVAVRDRADERGTVRV